MNTRELRKQTIRNAIIRMLPADAADIKKTISQNFNIKYAAVNKHLRSMIDDNSIFILETPSKSKNYMTTLEEIFHKQYTIAEGLAEDQVWRDDIAAVLEGANSNAMEIWNHGFTEMFNNAIDHSNGKFIDVTIFEYLNGYVIYIRDDGEGIFGKIQREFNLHDKRQALLELSKGKLTTDPERHTGEGIFFTSRAVDQFYIFADKLFFCHRHDYELDMITDFDSKDSGTNVAMHLCSQTDKELSNIFDEFAPAEEYTFGKTIVPIHLAQYDKDFLVSRSQAKRVLARIENFKVVAFDFEGVEKIGQAFADEIFRVFQNKYPDIELFAVNTTEQISAMITRARDTSVKDRL